MVTQWLPLESNPEVMNKFLGTAGVPIEWKFVDVFGLDDELLQMVPRPVHALLLLFPITENYERFKFKEEEDLKTNGQVVSREVFFTTQTVPNACGTVGLIHSVANNLDKINLVDGSVFQKLFDICKDYNPDERAQLLETFEGIAMCHEASALDGQTRAPSLDDKVDLHFVAFVEKDGHLYELDGRKPFPINHGKSSQETFLQDAARVCRTFMERDPDVLTFSLIALTNAP